MSSTNYNENKRGLSVADITFIIASIILFIGAIGIFIWLTVDAAEQHMVRNILFGSAFLLITFGLVWYSIGVYNHPRTSRAVMWTTFVGGLIVYIVGMCVHQSIPAVDELPSNQIENVAN